MRKPVLRQLTEHVYYLPPDNQRDRPMLGYVKGDRYSVAVDGGFSPDQVEEFYRQLQEAGLKKPDFTVLTHWHWDHTLGLPAAAGLVIASRRTNDLLLAEKKRLCDPDYEKRLRKWYSFVDEEFHGVPIPEIRTADIVFEEGLRLNAGGVTAELLHAEAPHTPDSTLICIPEDRVLFIGDASLGAFENGGRIDSEKKRALTAVIEKMDCDTLLLGHEGAVRKKEFLLYY